LESEVRDTKSSILKNESLLDACNKKGAHEDGLGRIRTGEVRHIKTDDFRISAPFSDTELDGDMTTRKAKAQL